MIEAGLYQVVRKDLEYLDIRLSDATHSVFQAHFPTNPILPGFLQIEILQKEMEIGLKSVRKGKFMQPVLPEDEIQFQILKKQDGFRVKGYVRKSLVSDFYLIGEKK